MKYAFHFCLVSLLEEHQDIFARLLRDIRHEEERAVWGFRFVWRSRFRKGKIQFHFQLSCLKHVVTQSLCTCPQTYLLVLFPSIIKLARFKFFSVIRHSLWCSFSLSGRCGKDSRVVFDFPDISLCAGCVFCGVVSPLIMFWDVELFVGCLL